jgi:protein gp37
VVSVSGSTSIEWTRGDDGTAGATWNFVTGCNDVSEGCDNCYARTFAERWRGVPDHPFEQGFDVRLWPERLVLPLRWRKPRRVFVNSMSDLWHDEVGTDLIARAFAVMAVAERHTFQVLTKRPGRMHSMLGDGGFWNLVRIAAAELGASAAATSAIEAKRLPNLWLGVSVESTKWAPVRLDKLAATTAGAVRFASCEPLLGELDLRPWLNGGLDWVIAGGESGPGARPMHPAWARSLREQCVEAEVAFFFKQWGAFAPEDLRAWVSEDGSPRGALTLLDRHGRDWTGAEALAPADAVRMRRVGKGRAGRLLDGCTWDEFPAARPVGAASSRALNVGTGA